MLRPRARHCGASRNPGSQPPFATPLPLPWRATADQLRHRSPSLPGKGPGVRSDSPPSEKPTLVSLWSPRCGGGTGATCCTPTAWPVPTSVRGKLGKGSQPRLGRFRMWKHWPEAIRPAKTEWRPLEELRVGADISCYLLCRETGIVGDAAYGPQPWMLAREGPHNLAPHRIIKGCAHRFGPLALSPSVLCPAPCPQTGDSPTSP